MSNRRCGHENTAAITDWIYCADCDDIMLANILCEHKSIENRSGWMHCTDCCETVGYYGSNKRGLALISATVF